MPKTCMLGERRLLIDKLYLVYLVYPLHKTSFYTSNADAYIIVDGPYFADLSYRIMCLSRISCDWINMDTISDSPSLW